MESPSNRRPPVPEWSSTTPTLKKMKSDEDLRGVLYHAASSSEAATRLSADEGDEVEVEDESNASRLEGPNKTGSSLTTSTGSRLRHIHSCPKDYLECFGNIVGAHFSFCWCSVVEPAPSEYASCKHAGLSSLGGSVACRS